MWNFEHVNCFEKKIKVEILKFTKMEMSEKLTKALNELTFHWNSQTKQN